MDPSRVTARAKSQPDERGRRGPHAVRARLSYETRLAGRRARSARLRLSYEAHRRLLANRSSGRRFAANPPALSDAQRQVLGDLRDNGIAITRFDELFGGTPLWDEQRREMDSFVREAESERAGQSRDDGPANKEGYLIRRMQQLERELERQGVDPPFPRLRSDDPWLRFASAGPILETVNAYRGMWTKLLATDQWYTMPFESADKRVGSQRWHRDPEDLHVVKVFVYFSRVHAGAGPFQYLLGSVHGGLYGDIWPWSIKGGYPPQDELATRIPDSAVLTATGDTGTVIFCDTSGFHRGGFAKTDPRILSVSTYVSPASYIARGRNSYETSETTKPRS